MKLLVISANLGGYDKPAEWPALRAPQGWTVEVQRLTDATCPPRPLAMTSRLQCGIPKWFGWQMFPGYDAYLWIDASCVPTPDAPAWFLERLGYWEDIAVFQHPERGSIRRELDFMLERMKRPGEQYLTSRYAGEWMTAQVELIEADRAYDDVELYASTAFIYRSNPNIRRAFQAIWSAKARFCLHDQFAFPYELAKASCAVKVMPDNYMQCPALTYVRNKKAVVGGTDSCGASAGTGRIL